MPGLEDLYREVILDHYRTPRNKGELPPPATCTEGTNPLCGDEIRLYLDVADGVVRDVRFSGHGCSISQSSASMMSAAVKGRKLAEVDDLLRAFKAMLNVGDESPDDVPAVKLGELEALRGVMKFPSRIKCATLSWNTLDQAITEATAGA